MGRRAAERGNAILIATILVLGMTVSSLALVRFLRAYVEDSADLRNSGFAATQAQYMAEAGINALMIEVNVRGRDPALIPTMQATMSSMVDYGPYGVPLLMEYQGERTEASPSAAPTEYAYRFTGHARASDAFKSRWSSVRRTVTVRIAKNPLGNPWRIIAYEQP